MNTFKKSIKVITSIFLAIAVFINLGFGITVNADDNTNNEKNKSTNVENEISKIASPKSENIQEENGLKYVNNTILIFFKDEASKEQIDGVISSINGKVVGQVDLLKEYQIQVEERTFDELNEVATNLMSQFSEYVAYACIDSISDNASIEPNDPWGKDEVWDEENVAGNNWGLEAIQAPSAWQYNNIFDESVDKINIGVVDGGFDLNTEDFPSNCEKFINSNIDLPYDHGTFVTSIIAAKANNNKGITGVVWNPGKIYLGCAATPESGSTGYLTLSGLSKGISDVIDNGANVVNCSFGGGDYRDSMVSAILMARMIKSGHDFVIVQASGNNGADASSSYWFAGIDEEDLTLASNLYGINRNDIEDRIIVVGAAELESDGSYMQAEFSNGGEKVNICAPGANVYSQYSDNYYGSGNGTSYAAPYVSGIVELTWRANPNLSGAEVRNIVCDEKNTIYDVPDNYNSRYATGDFKMANAKLSVESALKTRDDLVTLYYNSDSDVNVEYKLGYNGWETAKTVSMNDNIDNNGYNKSITISLDNYVCVFAKISSNNIDDNNGQVYMLKPGAYGICNGEVVKVKDKFSSLKIHNFTVDEGDYTTIGDNVNLSVESKDEVGEVQYAFSVVDCNGNETIIKDYSTKNTCSWYANNLGDFKLIVKIKDSRGYEVTKEKSFKVIARATVDSFKISPSKAGMVGNSVYLSTEISGGKGYCSCIFIAQGGNYPFGQKEKFFNMWSSTSGDWVPDMDGTYRIYCDIKDEAGTITRKYLTTYEVKKAGSTPVIFSLFDVNKNNDIEVGEEILLSFNYSGGYGSLDDSNSWSYTQIYAMHEDGTKESIDNSFYYANKINSVKWAPTKAGKWTIYLDIDDNYGHTSSQQLDINVNEYKKLSTENVTTIYYKGYSSPYIHYAVNNSNWTSVPGIKMIETSELSGYTHKYTINLGDSNNVSVCFNDGNGNWDSKGGLNYQFGAGIYTYSSGSFTKIGDSTSDFAVSYFRPNYESPRTATTSIEFRAETVNAAGDVNYTFKAINTNNGKETIINQGNNNKVTWTPTEAGEYTVSVIANDANGNTDVKTINYTVNETIKITSFSIDKISPVKEGTPLTINVEATGGTGSYSYNYYMKFSDSSFVGLGSSNENTFTWDAYGNSTCNIGVTVRDESNCRVEYDIPFTIEKDYINPLIIYGIYTDGDLKTNQQGNICISMYSKGVGNLTYNVYAIDSKGNKETIAVNSSTNDIIWTPSKSGDYMIYAQVRDEIGQEERFQENVKVIDKVQNYTTIYYNGSENTNIHYKVGNGEWTTAPGIPMIKTDELTGYTHKITLALGEEEELTCCFNDGKGNWDNNNQNDYSLQSGTYLISNNEVEKINFPTEIAIESAYLSKGTISLGESIDITTKVVSAVGECKYTIAAINQDTGKFETISKEGNNSIVSWQPSEQGTWYVYLIVEDDVAFTGGIMKLIVE